MNAQTVNTDMAVNVFLSLYTPRIPTKKFLDTKILHPDGSEGATNWEVIKRSYSKDELEENESKYPGNVLLKAGTSLELRADQIKRNKQKQASNEVVKLTGFKPFISEKLSELLRDPKYVKAIENVDGENIATIDGSDVTVFVWCRALTAANDTSQSGTWFNLSPFIQSIQTTVQHDHGNFAFILSPIVAEYKSGIGDYSAKESYVTQGGWTIANVNGYSSGDLRDDAVSQSSIIQYDPKNKGQYFRERFYFNTVLQENDLVYIKFEKLSMEIEKFIDASSSGDGRLNPEAVVGGVWDMIGLVDQVSVSTTPMTAAIAVNGRDMMKLLIEDGSVFFPEQITQDIFTDPNSILTKRNLIELEASSLTGAGPTFKTIETILKFIFNKFSNMGLVPNIALQGYGNKISKYKYELKSSVLGVNGDTVVDELNKQFLQEQREGVWRILDFVFDPKASLRVLADNSIATDNGSIINSIHKVCQEPFVEFWGDTYGDKYNFVIKKPPFDAIAYRGLVYDNYITDRDTPVNTNSRFGLDGYVPIQVENRFRRLNQLGRNASISGLVIDLDDVDVLGEPQFTYHNEIYSWYQVTPIGLGLQDEEGKFLLAPVVPLDEYAQVWGNRAFILDHNYVPSEYVQDVNSDTNNKYIEQQSFYDLQYVIQSNQYLPFARRGTIVLTGNRTIKRGLFVYLRATKEIFYVDSVQHTRSIDKNIGRTTTLQVSRGLREPYVKGKLVKFPTGEKKVSYFDIVNTDTPNNASLLNREFLKNWKVDKDIFNFFIQRRQWVD